MQMGVSEKDSVTDAFGRMHGMDNVYVADGGVFASSGGQNPTLTIMAVALRIARHLAGTSAPAAAAARSTAPHDTLPATGGRPLLPLTALAATAAGLAAHRAT
jgi:choline dehydrogenase-like flavoprotein